MPAVRRWRISNQCNFGTKEVPEKKRGTYVDVKSSYLSIGEVFIDWNYTHRGEKSPNVNFIQKIYAMYLYKGFREPGGGF